MKQGFTAWSLDEKLYCFPRDRDHTNDLLTFIFLDVFLSYYFPKVHNDSYYRFRDIYSKLRYRTISTDIEIFLKLLFLIKVVHFRNLYLLSNQINIFNGVIMSFWCHLIFMSPITKYLSELICRLTFLWYDFVLLFRNLSWQFNEKCLLS